MSFIYKQKIPTVAEIIQEIPLHSDALVIKKARDAEIKKVFTGESSKFILIIGPCSADNEDAVYEYTNRLCRLQEKVEDKIILIPRVYTNKPRTTGAGYKGMMTQPDPNKAPNIVAGLKAIRKMHINILKNTGFASADEMLYPNNYPYLEDVLSYVAIGARSVENQQHRLTASGLKVPVGMKNPMSGDYSVMLNSVLAAQLEHVFIYNDWEVETHGNDLAHCILRGAVDSYGRNIPNYHYEDLLLLSKMYDERELKNQAVIIDTSHSNCNKEFERQPMIAKGILHSMRHNESINRYVKGLMIESYLVEGQQKTDGSVFGQSITDPCLGWEASEKLVMEIAASL